MGAGKGIIVLIAATDRRIEPFGKCNGFRDRATDDDTRAVENNREFCFRQKLCGFGNRLATAARALQTHDLRQVDIDDLRPEIARNIDLRRRATAPCLLNHPVQHFGNAGRIAHFFLIADHFLEQRHLVHFLKAALTNGLVGSLWRDKQHGRVVPVGRLDSGHEAGHAGAILGNGHAHLAGHTRIAIADQRRIRLMRAIPEGNARLWKKIRHRHHRRADDAKCMFYPVHL